MEKLNYFLLNFVLYLSLSLNAFAQKDNSENKIPFSSKEIKREVKELEKQGYKPSAGEFPISYQYEKFYRLRTETDDNMQIIWLTIIGSAKSYSESAARMQATLIAKNNLVIKITECYLSLIDQNRIDNKFTLAEADSLSKIFSNSKQNIARKIGNVVNVIDIFKMENNTYYVNIGIAYNSEMAVNYFFEVLNSETNRLDEVTRKKIEGISKVELYSLLESKFSR